MKHEIETATAVYTGGGIYIYYGQLTSGLFFRTADGWESIDICNADTSTDEANYTEFYIKHTVEEITESQADFAIFWNAMLDHILSGKAAYGKWSNYDTNELKCRYIKGE